MDQQQNKEEENIQMLDTNIKQFIDAARQHFFGRQPAQAEVAGMPARSIH